MTGLGDDNLKRNVAVTGGREDETMVAATEQKDDVQSVTNGVKDLQGAQTN